MLCSGNTSGIYGGEEYRFFLPGLGKGGGDAKETFENLY
jgi:hypothetical protein